MIEISPTKVAHVIIKAREYDVKVAAWEDDSTTREGDSDSILEDLNDSTRTEVAEFIAALNVDEQANLVALAWVGRGSYSADEFEEAVEMAKNERVNKTEDYLLGIPLLADYLEDGLDKMGITVESAEEGVL